MSLYRGVYIKGKNRNYTEGFCKYYKGIIQSPSPIALLASGYILMGSINVAESNAWSYAEYEMLGDIRQRVAHIKACNMLSGCEKE